MTPAATDLKEDEAKRAQAAHELATAKTFARTGFWRPRVVRPVSLTGMKEPPTTSPSSAKSSPRPRPCCARRHAQ